ncbi:MAG: hypothetical protein AB7S38_00700 [Vulcanimicrobiota bacterium]
MRFPDSPHEQAGRLVADLQAGAITPAVFLERLEQMEARLEAWHARLEQLVPGDEHVDEVELVQDAAAALQAIYEGLGQLRDLAEGGQVAAAGLELIEEGSAMLVDLLQVTDDNLEELNRYQGPLIEDGIFG